jgi:acyl-CoA dehydrogenase
MALSRTDPKGGARGISIFLLHKNTPGHTISRTYRDMGKRAAPCGILKLENAQIPAVHLIGKENHSFYEFFW